MDPSRFIPRDRLDSFCRKWKIRELQVFGSVARGEEGPESDLDLLVTFEPGTRWSLLNHVRMEDELERLTARKVEMTTRYAVENSRNALKRDMVLAEAEPFYAA